MSKLMTDSNLRKKAAQIRLEILETIANAKKGHIGGAYSYVDMLVSLYYEGTFKFDWDPTGESVTHNIYFDFDAGHSIAVNCTKYKKSLKIENNWPDSLQVIIDTKEVVDWFNNLIN